MSKKVAKYRRKVDFSLRVHVIVRETEKEVKALARHLVSELDDNKGFEIRERAQDAKSLGVTLQGTLRKQSNDEGYVEPHLWTGIGRARSGCGAVLVGNPEQIVAKIRQTV